MPVSAKKIIMLVKELPEQFTREDLVKIITSDKKVVHSKGRTKKAYKSGKDIRRIEETLSVLVMAGFLKQKKGRYYRIMPMIIAGTLKVSSSGNAMLLTETNDEIIVKKEYTGHAHNNDRVSVSIIDYRRGYFYGKVDTILQRGKAEHIARIVKKTRGQLYLKLVDEPGEILLCTERKEKDPGKDDLLMVTLDGESMGNYPHCKIEDSFSLYDESYDLQRIRTRHSLPSQHGTYSELEPYLDDHTEFQSGNRKDYRSLFTVTIDGEDAKDFDDAISLEHKPEKKQWLLYVHIADVSAYVKKGAPLDKEALKRGTSFYLGRDVIPMLPEVLSNDKCSLRQDVDRLTMTAEVTINEDGTIQSYSFYKGIIKVNNRLTYTGVEEIIKTGEKSDTLSKKIDEMRILAGQLKKTRMQEGRLDLNLPEAKMIFKKSGIASIEYTPRLLSNSIIEEFMLTANVAVSHYLKVKNVPTLYRIHEEISAEKYNAVKGFMAQLGLKMSFKGGPGATIQAVIDAVSGKKYEHVVNMVILKSLMQAYYGITPLGHFGLGFQDYTHFTSPIRRYPDLIVHRCLKSLIEKKGNQYSNNELEEIGEISSTMERVAQRAERDMVKLKSCRLMYTRVGEIFKGIISGISSNGFFVTIEEMPIEGMVPLRSLTDDYYLVKEDDYTIIGKKYSRRFRLGDAVTVRLAKVDIELLRIDFDLP